MGDANGRPACGIISEYQTVTVPDRMSKAVSVSIYPASIQVERLPQIHPL